MPSADLYARAIIASAVNYGDDPIEALTVKAGLARRCLAPAITGLARGSQTAISDICRTLGYRTTSISSARQHGGVRFQKAQDAAEEAVRYALRTKALAERQEAPLAPAAPPKTIAEVRRRQEARPKGRAIPRGATLQNVGNGVQIIRLKPITPELLARARQQIAKGLSVEEFAELFDVDAERLSAALEGQAA
ncbi:hypothetical protein [Phenylobacterium sp.]|uniref:hypothetical protein n=1 Tax=Phenylobacterium sp. TaxID=1871053 RepID=UPI002731942D|nr:hypothetical protein [Phenylobacterium sp.]MDP1873665.1 hypothetical protein [Phenylobacterium sp.]